MTPPRHHWCPYHGKKSNIIYKEWTQISHLTVTLIEESYTYTRRYFQCQSIWNTTDFAWLGLLTLVRTGGNWLGWRYCIGQLNSLGWESSLLLDPMGLMLDSLFQLWLCHLSIYNALDCSKVIPSSSIIPCVCHKWKVPIV